MSVCATNDHIALQQAEGLFDHLVARPSIADGTLRSSALAVLRLITNSNWSAIEQAVRTGLCEILQNINSVEISRQRVWVHLRTQQC
jgi:hypothetical protein